MHYCCLIITKEFPSNTVIDNVMKPYCEEDFYHNQDENKRPLFMWGYYIVGGRYLGQLKLKVNQDDDDWKFYSERSRSDYLFRSYLLERFRQYAENSNNVYSFYEQDYYRGMGLREGFLYVDGAKIADVINMDRVGCCICVDAEGNAYAREYYDGQHWIYNEHFDEQVKEVLSKSGDYYACIVDIHD